METRELYLEVLSPAHIGCDEDYQPTSYQLDSKNMQLVIYDPFAIIEQIPDRDHFMRLCIETRKDSYGNIFTYMSKLPLGYGSIHSVNVCDGLPEHFKKVLSLHDARSIQQFAIQRTSYRCSDQRCYIPGSAVKGALRTAYLNMLAADKNDRAPRNAKDFEADLLGGKFATDPFRCVKVSDFQPVGETATLVTYVLNKKKRVSKFEAQGPHQLLEVIPAGNCFRGSITVSQPEREAGISKPITWESLYTALDKFYLNELQRERNEFKEAGLSVASILPHAQHKLVRIGRHSGAECVTISGYRQIRVKGQNRPGDHSITVWLTSPNLKVKDDQLLSPMGWVSLGILDSQKQQELQEEDDRWVKIKQERADTRKKTLAEAVLAQQKKEETRLLQKEMEQKERELTAQREAELAALSPEERMLLELGCEEIDEQRVTEIYRNIETVEGDLKREIAQGLKDYWMKVGKWDDRKVSKKQADKNAKIKSILVG